MTRTGIMAAALWFASPQAAPDPQVFRSGVEVVELDVSVMRGGVPVAGLTARDFALTDNGVAQDVESVMLEQLPLSVTSCSTPARASPATACVICPGAAKADHRR